MFASLPAVNFVKCLYILLIYFKLDRKNLIYTHRKSVFGVDIPKSLDVVENQPGQRYDHQNNERDRNE